MQRERETERGFVRVYILYTNMGHSRILVIGGLWTSELVELTAQQLAGSPSDFFDEASSLSPHTLKFS